MRRACAVLILLAACGDNHGPIDPPAGDHRYFVASRVYLPIIDGTSSGLDHLGVMFGALDALGVDVQGLTDRAVDTGRALDLFDVEIAGDRAALRAFVGRAPDPAACDGASDPVCRHHLDGHAGFEADLPQDAPATGERLDKTWGLRRGAITVELPMLGDEAVTLDMAVYDITADLASDTPQISVAGAIPYAELDAKLVPAIASNLAAVIARDCHALASPPACGCAAAGQRVIETFDASHDCRVTADELRAHPIIRSVAPNTGGDVPMVELNVGFDTVPARVQFWE